MTAGAWANAMAALGLTLRAADSLECVDALPKAVAADPAGWMPVRVRLADYPQLKALAWQRIAHVLAALDGERLRPRACLFGGGTCIALRHGEYQESVDIGFLVSDLAGHRALRKLLKPT